MPTFLQINALSKSYGPQVIFEHASLTVTDKQKIGVIGRNGAGKSTLFKMIVGDETPDSGSIVIHDVAHLGYLQQQDPYTLDETVMDFLRRASGKEEWQCAKVAGQFDMKHEKLSATIGSLSGGYQMRVKLTAMLLQEPNLLLLDEPTNYLDLHTLILLEAFLRGYTGSFMVITHDREFLKNTCEQTLEVEHGKLFLHPEPIEAYLAFKEHQIELGKLYNKKVDRDIRHLQKFVDRFRYKASKASQAQSKLKQIDRLKKIDIEHSVSAVRIRMPQPEEKKGLMLRTNALTIGYAEQAIASDITLDIERGEHIAILGENGQGKSTFLKTIAGLIPSLGGNYKWRDGVKLAYYSQHVSTMLPEHQDIQTYLTHAAYMDVKFEQVLEMASNFLFRGLDLKKPISVLSGGEKARLCLAGLLLGKHDVLILDEPTNHLDFETVESLGSALGAYKGTVLFVSHNRTFVNLIATGIVEVNNGTLRRYPHNYEEYVYHLSQLVQAPVQPEQPAATKETNKERRAALHDAIKTHKKEIREIEHTLAEYEKEKQVLHNYFARNPTKYAPEKMERLHDVGHLIQEQEKQWMETQETVDALQRQL